jgi:outer membrane protein OmpA-like peptidoglycan-associated protein
MKMKQHPLFTILTALVLLPKLATATEIRQEEFRYAMNLAQDIACTTFVITDMPRSGKLAVSGCQPPMVHFQLGSAVVTPAEVESFMTGLRTCAITKNTPLVVTGHTCPLGTEQLNQTLSLQRAKAVATFLRNLGFTVAGVDGRGFQAPVTTVPRQLFLNRRAEITAVSHEHDVTPVSQGR